MAEQTVKDVKRRNGKALTGRQTVDGDYGVVVSVAGLSTADQLASNLASNVTYADLRATRQDATVSFARALAAAPVIAAEWSIEADDETPDEIVEFLRGQMFPLRSVYMERAALGTIDFGWQAFEKVLVVENDRIILRELKPLLHDLTTILIEKASGAFLGLWQERDRVFIPKANSILANLEVEGQQYYGRGRLQNAHIVQSDWSAANSAAKNYNAKVAGSRWVLYFDPGESIFEDVLTDNAEISKTLLTRVASSGSIGIPDKRDPAGNRVWELESKSDAGAKQVGFIDYLEYLDHQKLRAFLLPERSAIEGRFGTKAEAEAHIEIALTVIENMNRSFTTAIQNACVPQLISLNFGPTWAGKVRLRASSIQSDVRRRLRDVYLKILESPLGFAEEFETLDTDAIKDQLGLPKAAPVAQAGAGEV